MQILAKSVGRRKEAVAQVQILRGTGQFIINNKPAQEYLQNDSCSLISVKAPFEILLMSTSKSTAGAANPGGVSLTVPPSNPTTFLTPEGSGSDMVQGGIENGSMNKNSLNELSIDTIVKVKGGGLMGQAEAIRLGIARALCLLSSKEGLGSGEEKLPARSAGGQLNNSKSEPVVQTSVGPNSIEEKDNPDQPLVGMSGETTIYSLDVRKQLKDKGYLTQDSRVKERRKYGLKKARKASQYHKR